MKMGPLYPKGYQHNTTTQTGTMSHKPNRTVPVGLRDLQEKEWGWQMKDKRYYYQCITACQMAFMAPSNRREDVGEDGVPPFVHHERAFTPAGSGGKDAHFLATIEPISRRYVSKVDRIFEKRDLKSGKILKLKSPTTIKFVEMDPDDVDGDIRKQARFMTLRDMDLAKTDGTGPLIQKKSGMYEIVEEDGIPVAHPVGV